MSIAVSIHQVTEAYHRTLEGVKNDALRFISSDGSDITIFLPPHVAAATAAAFNAAMAEQAETEGTPA
tara:strand:+ start:8723 stop:8926 length:204 start_codon:yes stop_codon:yes gene_type:complete